MACKTLSQLLASGPMNIEHEFEADAHGEKVVDVRWFTQIIRVAVNSEGIILSQKVFDYEELYDYVDPYAEEDLINNVDTLTVGYDYD